MTPFLTFYTPTFRRPQALAACLASVQAQTAIAAIEQIVVVDHVGVGVDGMYARIPQYVDAVHGRYVHVLADDDVLSDPTVVAQVRDVAERAGHPPLIVVRVRKGIDLPVGAPWPPCLGRIDLGCFITRADIWKRHAVDYGHRYEGDFDFAKALNDAGIPAVFADIHFLTGGVNGGRPEAVTA